MSMMWQVVHAGVRRLVTQAFGSQLRRNISSGVAATGVNMLVLLISYPVYLHFLGYGKYGLWLILATVLGFAQLGLLGINSAVTKLVAEEYGQANLRGVQSYVTMAWTILTVTGTIALLAILFFKGQIVSAFKLGGANAEVVRWLLPYIGALSVYVLMVQATNATLAGLGRMDLANYTQTGGRIVAVVVSVLLLFFGRGVESLLIGNTFSYITIHIISLVLIRRQARVRFLRLGNWDWGRLRRLLSFSSGLFGCTVMSILLDPFNKLVLSRCAGVASIPVYDIAYRAAMQIRGMGDAGLRAMMPEISRVGAEMTLQAHERIRGINRRAMKLIITLATPIFLALFILAPVLLKLWLGKSFVEALPPAFRTILVGTFFSLLCVPAFHTLLGLGQVRYCFFSSAIQGGVNAAVIITIILVSGKISAYSISWALMMAMGMTSVYILRQKYRVMQKNLAGTKLSIVSPVEEITKLA